MPQSSVNVIQLLRIVLVNNDLISDLVGPRVLTGHRFDADENTIPMPAIILSAEGGLAMSNKAKQQQIIHLYAYSRTSEGEALDVYAAAYDALESARLFHEHISTAGYCYETDRPRTGYNDRMVSWFARGTWIVQAAG